MGKKMSIQLQYSLIFIATLLLVTGAFIAGLSTLRRQVLHNEAAAVADQVIAFRAWVANSGMVWVNKLSSEFPDFLAKDDGVHAAFYGKNPALATRELSTIANNTSMRATFLVTSDDYRQAANKPDSFESMAISSFKNQQSLTFMDAFEGNTYRYARPILVKQGCLKCHGRPEDAPPAVIEKYGDSKAFGYKVGDVRGIISVKLPTISLKNILPVLSNPFAIAMVVFAFLLNFLFTKFVIIKRLGNLTKDAAAIAKGKLTTILDYTPPAESNNEIDHAYHSVNLLKKSMAIILKKRNKKK